MGHLRALEKKDMIERIPGQARTFRINRPDAPEALEIPEDATEVVDIPIVGDIAAGYPDRVEPAGEIGRLQVDIQSAGFSSRRRSFALKVRGESMVDAEIAPFTDAVANVINYVPRLSLPLVHRAH